MKSESDVAGEIPAELPCGWSLGTVEELVEKIQYGSSAKTDSDPDGVPVLRMGNIQGGAIVLDALKYLPQNHSEFPELLLTPGDLLFNRTNSPELVGKSAVYRGSPPHCSFASYLIRLRLKPDFLPDYLSHYLNSCFGKQWIASVVSQQVGQANVSGGKLKNLRLPIPPLNEQRRIVAKIEELFSELDKGIENLKQARAQLAVYRQALLKHAFEGKLTAKWRLEHPNLLKSEAELIADINSARQQRSRVSKSGNAQEELDRTTLPPIPAEWAWARLDAIGFVGSGMSVSKDREFDNPVEVPYLRVANVQRGRLDLSVMKTMKVEAEDLEGLRLRNGDVLFNEGGDRDKLGRGWIWEGQIDPCITQNHVFRVTPVSLERIAPKFLSHWGNTFGQEFFLTHGKQTTNLASINKAALSRLPVPVPTIAEQHEIVLRLEEQLSVLDALVNDIDENLQKAEALRQSNLKKAFAGELVPQDPHDEPASVLLARIREGRASATAAPKSARRAKPMRTESGADLFVQ